MTIIGNQAADTSNCYREKIRLASRKQIVHQHSWLTELKFSSRVVWSPCKIWSYCFSYCPKVLWDAGAWPPLNRGIADPIETCYCSQCVIIIPNFVTPGQTIWT